MERAWWKRAHVAGLYGPIIGDRVVTAEQSYLAAAGAADLGPVRICDPFFRAVIGPVVTDTTVGAGLRGHLVVVGDSLDRASIAHDRL